MPFIYRPLHSEARHVRYVSLAPGDPGGPISLVLIHAPLEEAEASSTASTKNDVRSGEPGQDDEQASSISHSSTPPYTVSLPDPQYGLDGPPRFTGTYSALSYCWGDRATKHEIILRYVDDPGPGAIFPISENLHSFLSSHSQRAGQGSQTEWLWIDQLCIDQSNYSEKHGQISLMGDIYSQAALVIVWLGPAFEQSDQLMKVLKSGFGVSFTRILAVDAHLNIMLKQMKYNLALRELRKSALDVLGPCIKALEILLTLAYWSRVWICQEFLLGGDGVVYIGNSSLPIKHFCRQLQYLRTIRALSGLDAKEVLLCHRLIMARLLFTENPWNWQRLLHLMEGRECERYEDRIHGILGLLKRSTRIIVPISMPAFSGFREQFFRNVVRQLMVEGVSERRLLWDAGYNALTVRRLLQMQSTLGRFAVLKMVLSVFDETMAGRSGLTRRSICWSILAGTLIERAMFTSQRTSAQTPYFGLKGVIHGVALSMPGTIEP